VQESGLLSKTAYFFIDFGNTRGCLSSIYLSDQLGREVTAEEVREMSRAA